MIGSNYRRIAKWSSAEFVHIYEKYEFGDKEIRNIQNGDICSVLIYTNPIM